jgi:serine/threonine protein kinase
VSLQPGTVFDRYVVEDVLGEGGMALVYRVRHRELGGLHAMKVLKPDQQDQERLMREGRAQAKLRHPNVVSVTDVVRIDDMVGLVMEYVDGPNLQELAKDRAMPVAELDPIAKQLFDGVVAAHQAGLVHRDLKPANVLMARGPDGLTAKIADFGIVKLKALETITPTRAAMGSPAYMAPEQMRDAANVDSQADIWSLGAVLYELATGNRAFAGGDVMVVLAKVMQGQYPPLPEDLPLRWRFAIEGALRIETEGRWATAEDLRSAWFGETPSAELPGLATADPLTESGTAQTTMQLTEATRRPAARLPWIGGAALMISLGVAVGSYLRTTPEPGPIDTVGAKTTQTSAMRRISMDGAVKQRPSILEDPLRVRYILNGNQSAMMMTHDVVSGKVTRRKVPFEVWIPDFSPTDGRWVGIRKDGDLWLLGDGEPRRLAEAGHASWSPDGNQLLVAGLIQYAPGQINGYPGLFMLDPATGERQHLADVPAMAPSFSPDGSHFVYSSPDRELWVTSVQSINPRKLEISGRAWSPVWTSRGIFFIGSTASNILDIYRLPVDERGNVIGPQDQLTQGRSDEVWWIDVNRLGTALAGYSGHMETHFWRANLSDDLTEVGPFEKITEGRYRFGMLSYAQGGQATATELGVLGGLWYPFAKPTPQRVASAEEIKRALWSPDGSTIVAHMTGETGLFRRSTDAAEWEKMPHSDDVDWLYCWIDDERLVVRMGDLQPSLCSTQTVGRPPTVRGSSALSPATYRTAAPERPSSCCRVPGSRFWTQAVSTSN